MVCRPGWMLTCPTIGSFAPTLLLQSRHPASVLVTAASDLNLQTKTGRPSAALNRAGLRRWRTCTMNAWALLDVRIGSAGRLDLVCLSA
jgi:hypothetical protein